MAEASDCKRQIVKIGENNVELQYYLLSPVTGARVVLGEYTVAYGQTKIDNDRISADAEWEFWDGLDAKGIADKIKTAANEVDYFNLIQDVMTNAADGTVIDLE
uniref:Uncharacterized protein n=1 Tax=viral metagenome TaxID=1070528 RepID=A0A6M3J1E6_9ZZZZ